jgi:hypothetical protein
VKQSQKPEEAPAVMPRPKEENTRVRLAIEELETRLAPQSTMAVVN